MLRFNWKYGLAIALALLVTIWAFESETFKKCVAEEVGEYAKRTDQERASVQPTAIMRLDCFGRTVDRSSAAVTALATLAIVWLTFSIAGANATMAKANEEMAAANKELAELASRQEEATRTRERAYLFCGGLFGVPKKEPQPVEEQMRPKASYFKPPWRMVFYNWGNTPAFLKRIRYGVCPESKFLREVRVSDIVEKRLLNIEEPISIQEIIASTGTKPIPSRHVEIPREPGTVFFGRIDYVDVFGKDCHSCFALYHKDEHTDAIGSSFSDDWS